MADSILLIEDEPAIADTIVYALETQGFKCSWQATGSEGMNRLQQEQVDLVILDVGLPDSNGFELCKLIRKEHQLPIIFLTARADEIDRVVGLEIGADDYVTKPFSPRELAARVKAVLRRSRIAASSGSEEISHTHFQVDEPRCRISFRGQALSLSRYEYRLLTIFIGRPGRVFSREKLMNMAWDEPEASTDRTVDAHIKSIRAKLKRVDPEADPIQTHRGLGYSLREAL